MKKILNAIGIMLSVFISIIYISVILTLSITLIAKDFISEKNISNLIGEDLLEVNGEETILGQTVYEFIKDTDLTKEDVKEFINKKEIKDIVGKYASKYINTTLSKEQIYCDDKELKNIFHNNNNFFKKLLKDGYDDLKEIVDKETICDMLIESLGENDAN